jgi:hypothetical protein
MATLYQQRRLFSSTLEPELSTASSGPEWSDTALFHSERHVGRNGTLVRAASPSSSISGYDSTVDSQLSSEIDDEAYYLQQKYKSTPDTSFSSYWSPPKAPAFKDSPSRPKAIEEDESAFRDRVKSILEKLGTPRKEVEEIYASSNRHPPGHGQHDRQPFQRQTYASTHKLASEYAEEDPRLRRQDLYVDKYVTYEHSLSADERDRDDVMSPVASNRKAHGAKAQDKQVSPPSRGGLGIGFMVRSFFL